MHLDLVLCHSLTPDQRGDLSYHLLQVKLVSQPPFALYILFLFSLLLLLLFPENHTSYVRTTGCSLSVLFENKGKFPSLKYQNYSSSNELKCVAVVQRLGFHAEFLIEKKRLPQREKTMS